MTMYLVCSADIWHSQYLWCFSPWPSQIKRFIYEDRFMQDFLLVHLLKSEMVYSNIGLLWKLCWRVLLETVEKYYFCLFLPNQTHFCNTPLLRSVCLSSSLNVPMSHNMVNRRCSNLSPYFGPRLLCPRPPSGRSLPPPHPNPPPPAGALEPTETGPGVGGRAEEQYRWWGEWARLGCRRRATGSQRRGQERWRATAACCRPAPSFRTLCSVSTQDLCVLTSHRGAEL